MRRKILSICLLISLSSLAQTQPFLQNLGRGIDQNIECSCVDKDNNLVVAYRDNNNQELVFDKWDLTIKQWKRNIARVPSVKNQLRNESKCLYKNDTLFVVTGNKDDGTLRPTIYYFLSNKAVKLANFHSSRGEAFVSDIKVLGKNIVVFGLFEYVLLADNTEKIPVANITIFNHTKWVTGGSSQVLKSAFLANLPASANKDTVYLIANDNLNILRYIYPEKIETVRKSEDKIQYTSVTHFNDRILLTKLNSDSCFYIKNRSFVRFKIDRILGAQLSVVPGKKEFIIAEDGKVNSIYLLDTSKKVAPLIFKQALNSSGVTTISGLIKVKSSIFYHFNTPIIYKGIRFDNLVELNLDVDRTLKTTVITLYLFDDANKNNIRETGEVLVPGVIRNLTYGYQLSSATGKFTDEISQLTDVEYAVLVNSLTSCLKPAFSGAIKTNLQSGITELNFPLQITKKDKNLILKSYGKATARILDTIPLNLRIFSKDCDNSKTDVNVTLKLDSNTQLINSIPNYSSKSGNTYSFKITNLSPNVDSVIKVNILYSNTKYKIEQYVRHYVTMKTLHKEDSTDNTDSIVQKMTYSYDPNAKYSIPQGKITSNLNYIRYYIQFQNEGNDYARRVTVVDTIDTRIPVYEFQMVGASHAYNVSITNNVITWTFDNINLQPKSKDEKGSEGFIVFDAHVITNFGVGDSIHNKAYIYFDFNEPIITNLAIIERIEDLPVIEDNNSTFRVFPNPANVDVTIENKIDQLQTIKVYNIMGQEVLDVALSPIGKTTQSIATWPRGMYFIKSSEGDFQKFLVH